MARMGRQSDLARELNISRSAVSQAFKKHNIQLAINGLFDLDHAIYLLQKNRIRLLAWPKKTQTKSNLPD